MRLLDERTTSYLRGPVLVYGSRIEAWRDGKLLLRVPVTGGRYTSTAGTVERSALVLTVPATDELRPSNPRHPLAPYGQRLRLVATLGGPDGVLVDVPIGWFRIDDSRRTNESETQIDATDPSSIIEEARLVTPREVGDQSGGARIVDSLAFLTGTLVPVWTEGLPNKLIGSKVILRDRLKGLEELLNIWGATGRWDVSGSLLVRPIASTTGAPVMRFDDGIAGTIIDVDREARPSQWFNACIVEGATRQGAPIHGAAYLRRGPMAWPSENYSSLYGFRPGFYASQLLTTVEDCMTTAQTMLAQWQRGAQGVVSVKCIPDPRVQIDDVIEVAKGGRVDRIIVTEVSLPLNAESGEMTIEGAII